MPKILIVDDAPVNLKLLSRTLKNPNYEILVATNGKTALEIVASQDVDLILLDIMMPEMDGYEVCEKLKADTVTQKIPIIFITAQDDEENEMQGLKLGAVDYITKPISPPIVQARVKTHLQLKFALETLEKKNVALEETTILRDNVDHILRHDLKTPINGILNYSMILMEMLELNPQPKKMLSQIEALSYEVLDMINHFLDLYKMEMGNYQYQPTKIDILSIVNKITAETENLSSAKNLPIHVFIDDRIATQEDTFIAQGEQLLCYSMLANLLKNAIEASPISAPITVYLTTKNETITIRIHNQGAVPEKIRANFFDKYTTAGKPEGSGLGTYSARLMAETQGGSIYLETSEETGTSVTVQLPINNL